MEYIQTFTLGTYSGKQPNISCVGNYTSTSYALLPYFKFLDATPTLLKQSVLVLNYKKYNHIAGGKIIKVKQILLLKTTNLLTDQNPNLTQT